MQYFIIAEKEDESNVLVTDIPDGLTRKYQLLKGISRQSDWPSHLAATFSDLRPEGKRLTDWIPTPFGWLLISDRFKKLIENTHVQGIEYLPIRMKDHAKKPVKGDYWIVNFLSLVEAVDRAKSVFEGDAAVKDKIYTFERLVLRSEIMAKGPPIFRAKEQPRLVLVREDLAAQITENNLTGLKLVESTKYKTLPPYTTNSS